jgi:hypothetical protein
MAKLIPLRRRSMLPEALSSPARHPPPVQPALLRSAEASIEPARNIRFVSPGEHDALSAFARARAEAPGSASVALSS